MVAVGPDTVLTGRSCRPLSAETPGHVEVQAFWPTWQAEVVRGVVIKSTGAWEERRVTPRPTALEDPQAPGAAKPEAVARTRPKLERTAECPGCEQTGAHSFACSRKRLRIWRKTHADRHEASEDKEEKKDDASMHESGEELTKRLAEALAGEPEKRRRATRVFGKRTCEPGGAVAVKKSRQAAR